MKTYMFATYPDGSPAGHTDIPDTGNTRKDADVISISTIIGEKYAV